MARRKLIWHLGLADAARPVVPLSLDVRREALESHGVLVAADRHEAELATLELLHTHREAGRTRKEVEGRWAAVADRVWAHRGTSVVSTPQLCTADRERLRLALDPMIGVEVHLVVTVESLSEQIYGAWVAALLRGSATGWRTWSHDVQLPALEGGAGAPGGEDAQRFWAGHELASLLARWGWTLHADRLHVVLGSPEVQWAQLLQLAGVPADAAPAIPPMVPDPAAPASAALLREVNRRAGSPLSPTDRQLLLAARAPGHVDAAPPTSEVEDLVPLVERWERTLRAGGYDVRGSLASLLSSSEPVSLPRPRERFATAAAALAEALEESALLRERVRGLEAEVERLDRKRRTWKRRAKAGKDDGTDVGTDGGTHDGETTAQLQQVG